MNLKAHIPGFKVWSKAQADIDRITEIWRECLQAYGGPYLFGELSIADAMYAPVVTRFRTYDVKLDEVSAAYCEKILAWPAMQEWQTAASFEKDEIEELEVEF
jgi:glutathione S-transferase